MQQITAILVDDEESARDILSHLLARFCPSVKLAGQFNDLETAVKAIGTLNPDVVFLDIEMPRFAGYEIVQFFDKVNFEIVFITAYDKYALKAFEVSAVDYLLKPVDIERLKAAVEKLNSRISMKDKNERLQVLQSALKNKELKNIIISDKGYQYKIDLSTVIAIEAQESYCYIHTGDTKYTVSKNLKHFEELLADNADFFRAHKSWIVNFSRILNYSKSNFEIRMDKNITAKLSKYRKAEFEQAYSG